MGIQINGNTDIISATDGSLSIQGASGNITGDVIGNLTGNVTGNVNATGVSTFSNIRVTGGTISGVSTAGITTAYINTLSGISTIDASSAVSINQNLVFASGKGIDFSATANSSGTMTSELLSDYEEGTWTPVYRQGSSSGTAFTVSGGTQYARYIKVGRIVLVNFGFTSSTVSGSAGAMYITGFPFTLWSTGSAGLRSIGTSIFYINGFNTSGNVSLFAEDTYAVAVAQGTTNWSVPTYTPASGSFFHCSFTYEADS